MKSQTEMGRILPYIPDMDGGTFNTEFLTSFVFFKRFF
jgi:hypothetical protein